MEEEAPLDAAGFRRMIAGKRAVALAMQDDRIACREAWMAAGYSVEFALNALILRKERLNGWPSREARPELHTHNLRRLFTAAGLDFSEVPASTRGALRTALDWDRLHEYDSRPMPRRVAKAMVEAAFGDQGVVQWLNTL